MLNSRITTNTEAVNNTYLLSYGFHGSGVQAWLSGTLCKAIIKVLARAGFSSGGSSGDKSAPKLSQVVDRFHFLQLYDLGQLTAPKPVMERERHWQDECNTREISYT